METKFYKLVNGNELSNFDIISELENIENNKAEKVKNIINLFASMFLSISVTVGVVKNKNPNYKSIWGICIDFEYMFKLLLYIIICWLMFGFCFWLLSKFCHYVYVSFFKSKNSDTTLNNVVNAFYRKVQNQIIMGASLIERTIEFSFEIEKNSCLGNDKLNYHDDLCKLYLHKALFYYQQAINEIRKNEIDQIRGEPYTEIVNIIGKQAMIDTYLCAINSLHKIERIPSLKDINVGLKNDEMKRFKFYLSKLVEMDVDDFLNRIRSSPIAKTEKVSNLDVPKGGFWNFLRYNKFRCRIETGTKHLKQIKFFGRDRYVEQKKWKTK